MQRDNYKKIRVMANGLDPERFQIDGVNNLTQENGAVRFFYKGDINAITRLLAGVEVSDLTIEEPTLEEIFMHYYE